MPQEPAEMKSPLHATFVLPACPLLPEVSEVLGPMATRVHASGKGEAFYHAALCYAQSLWREGKPAQAILQLNKSFMADLQGDEDVLVKFPPSYAVLLWFLRHRPDGCFVGNPVRHFQHLATRVSGERKEIRAWRAWACFHLSRAVLPEEDFPVDHEQVAKDGLVFPEWGQALAEIRRLGWKDEESVLSHVAAAAG